ncbi:hypothetical protein Tco_0875648 [Tanacetum coccineum]|uniref:Uncharacterized protein n=1 Tax=Tanacetum coccineum TaxID=301880 RepID=A0ABQ5BST8_9ASTR
MPTEMELTLEQTQQGVSYEVSNIRVNSFTMKMEILLEPTSNKLMVEHAEYDESNTYVLERFNTSAGNPVKKILLKLNLSDHRLCKMVVEVPDSSWLTRSITTCSYPTDKHKVIMKAQNIRVNSFTMKMEILLESTSNKLMVDPHGFEGYVKWWWRSVKVLKLKNFKKDATLKLFKNEAQDHYVKYKFKEQAQSKKSMTTTTYSQEKDKREVCEHKNEDLHSLIEAPGDLNSTSAGPGWSSSLYALCSANNSGCILIKARPSQPDAFGERKSHVSGCLSS